MKKKFQLGAIIAAAIIICFDAIVLIVNKNFDKQFYLGFIIVNVAFLAYILVKLLVKRSEEERGVFPLDMSILIYALLMMVLAIIAFVLPRHAIIFTTLIIVNIIFFTLVLILVVFGIFTKEHVKNDNREKRLMLSKDDMVGTLQQIQSYVKEDAVKNKLSDLITLLEAKDLDPTKGLGAQVKEYIGFMYRDAVNSNLDNLVFNMQKVEKLLSE